MSIVMKISIKSVLFGVVFLALSFSGCRTNRSTLNDQLNDQLDFAVKQTGFMVREVYDSGKLPRALYEDGTIRWVETGFDWTEGFFPGTCWYLYEYSHDKEWENRAQHLQSSFFDHRYFTNSHDLGFIFNCSYGNGYRLSGNDSMKQVLVEAGNTLINRFDPKVGCIRSWNVDNGWQAARGWEYPVIIDNLMNLELLFKLSEITGDARYKEVAVAHADNTLINHFRPDGSSYHVVDYDSITGEVRSRQTAQGYSDESVWSRGQAWGLYGYTMCYRFTKETRYLNKAVVIADYLMTQPNLPADHIPYWDYSAPNIPDAPRDASAAAVIASALVELSQYVPNGTKYRDEAALILENLSSPAYRAKLGSEGGFILKHSVGSIPHKSEVDVPIVYGDYYYVEALLRLKALISENE